MRSPKTVTLLTLALFVSQASLQGMAQNVYHNFDDSSAEIHVVKKEQLKLDLTTEDEKRKATRAKVSLFLRDHQVKTKLEAFGLDLKQLETRVAALSPEELEILEKKVDLITEQYPGGALSVGAQVALAIIVIAVIYLLVKLDEQSQK